MKVSQGLEKNLSHEQDEEEGLLDLFRFSWEKISTRMLLAQNLI